jgi:5-methylcytosine-specific restriction endonuclease McrA
VRLLLARSRRDGRPLPLVSFDRAAAKDGDTVSEPADLRRQQLQAENMVRLASRFRARELDLEAERQVARVVLEAGGESEQPNGNGNGRGRPAGDRWQDRRQIGSGWAWGELRAAVRARDRVCVRCGSRERLAVHHRVPLAEGGTNELQNLELRCSRCHVAAHSGELEQPELGSARTHAPVLAHHQRRGSR